MIWISKGVCWLTADNLIWVQSMVRLASTAVQHQLPQLQPKQPSLHWCHFVAWLLAIFAPIIRPFQGQVHGRLFCQMHCSILVAMSDGNVSQWCVTGCHGWSGWINCSFYASSGIWSLLWQDMFLRSQGLVVLGAKREGSKDGFCLEAFLRFPFEQLIWKHVVLCCFCFCMGYNWLIGR